MTKKKRLWQEHYFGSVTVKKKAQGIKCRKVELKTKLKNKKR